jgi:hypothetical protein
MKTATHLMLATLAIASLSAVVLPMAHANSGEHASLQSHGTFVSAKTRAEVRAEAIAARKAGLIAVGERTLAPELDRFVSTKTRAEVRAEAIAARRAGLIAYGERSLAQDLDRFASTKTRAQVIAELREAQRLGLLPSRGEASEPIVPTAEQLRLIAEAGERAAAGRVAAVR